MQDSVFFRMTMLPSFFPGYMFYSETSEEPSRGNCDLISPLDKKYLFRFIGRLPGYFKGYRICRRLINVFRERWRKFVPLNKAFSRERERENLLSSLFRFRDGKFRRKPHRLLSLWFYLGNPPITASNGICIPTSRRYAPRCVLYTALQNYCILKRILDEVSRPQLWRK